MIELTRTNDTWQVVENGQPVFTSTMAEARAEYSRRMAEQLAAKGTARKRKVFR